MPPLIMQLLASSVKVASHAGKIIKKVFSSGDLKIVEKEPKDLQTEADRLAQNCIISSLLHLFPKVIIIGEEEIKDGEIISVDLKDPSLSSILTAFCPKEVEDLTEEQIVIWVDPLDGTSEFTQGQLNHVTVLIGMAVEGKPLAGVIHQPWNNDRTIWGLVGCGMGNIVPRDPPIGELIIVTSRSHSNQNNIACVQAMNADHIIHVGGLGYKVIMLLEGKAHAYIFANSGSKKWDTCAPEAILNSIGGVLTSLHGEYYPYYKDSNINNAGGILATLDPKLHAQLIKCIPTFIKDSLEPVMQ